jgi:hypothetical protein
MTAIACASGCGVALAQPAPPGNDNYLSSWIVPQAAKVPLHKAVSETSFSITEDTSAASTQADLFNPDRSGLPFGGGGAEPSACNGVSYGKTVWYDLHPSVPMGVELLATGFPTAIAVYQWNVLSGQLIRQSVFCHLAINRSTGQPQPTNDFVYPGELQAGKAYTVQVGGLATGGVFASGSLAFTANLFPDHDGDGVIDGIDKCDFLPGVQRFGGCPPALHARPAYTFTNFGTFARLDSLTVGDIPGGARVTVRCRACGRSAVVSAGPHASSVTVPALTGTTMRNGAKLEIWVTKARVRVPPGGSSIYQYGSIGSYVSYTVGGGALGSRVLRCLLPGSLTPRLHCP